MARINDIDRNFDRKAAKKFYRYVDYWQYEGEGVKLMLETYYSYRETPKGHWITDNFATFKKWVSTSGRRRYAYPTKEEALHAFVCRKNSQISIVKSQFRKASLALIEAAAIKRGLESPLTEKQLSKCKHLLGIDRSPKVSYRNYYNSGQESDKELDKLVQSGLISKREADKSSGGIYYHMTDKGIIFMKSIVGNFEVNHD